MPSLLDLFKSSFSPQTGRGSYIVDGFFIKKYADRHECAYEYAVLGKIAAANPTIFLVPKVFKMSTGSGHSSIVMERIEGNPLQNFIMNFLLFKESEALKILNGLGKALRELHYINLKGLHNGVFPNSLRKIKLEIFNLSRTLGALNVLDHKFRDKILNIIEGVNHINDEIFANVNLHGEFYFTHILLSKNKYVFFDFHNTCKGPSYFDLAMLSISLYASITLPFYTPRQLTPLIHAFLTGYYGERLSDKMFKSIELTELYVNLREILTYARDLHGPLSINKLLAMLKIRRLKTAIEEVILPNLT
ncbi:MAG: aminoglycoside phosphotransferase family protein [Thermoproteota archaeon]